MNETILLAIATLALVVGPVLHHFGRPIPWLSQLVDGATVGGILVVSLVHLMPEAGAHLGLIALVLFALGLILPSYAERMLERSHHGLRLTVGVLVAVLFVIHELIESAALASKASDARLGLATLLVVVGHRLPLGLLLWGHTRRRIGSVWSSIILLLVVAATWFGPELAPTGEGEFSAVLSALLAGGLLHLVLQHGPPQARNYPRIWSNFWSSLGLIGASVGMFFILAGHGGSPEHEHGGTHLPAQLQALAFEAAGPILLGLIGAALIEAYMPQAATRWLSGGPRLVQAFKGMLVGTPMPICSCGVLPVYRSLVQRGVSGTAALALLVAAPEIGIDSLVLSFQFLGQSVTWARLACAAVLALVVGYFVGARAEPFPAALAGEGSQAAIAAPRGLSALRRGFLETWGRLGPWILFGLAAAVLVEPWISTEWAASVPPWLQVVVLCAIGMPTYICATAATPLAAVLLAKGFAPGAVIAFLLTGPATNWTTFGALTRLHSGKTALRFVATALACTIAMGLVVNAVLEPGASTGPVHEHAHEHHSPWGVAAAICLALMTLWVLLREGPRAFLGQLWNNGEQTHDRAPSDDHGHVHAKGEAMAAAAAGQAAAPSCCSAMAAPSRDESRG